MITKLFTRLILFLAASASFFRHTHDGYSCTSALAGDAWDEEWIDEIEARVTK
jgi:hypothetical protein